MIIAPTGLLSTNKQKSTAIYHRQQYLYCSPKLDNIDPELFIIIVYVHNSFSYSPIFKENEENDKNNCWNDGTKEM